MSKLDHRLERALQRLELLLPAGFTVTAVNAHTASITLPDGKQAIVQLDPSTGCCKYWPVFSRKSGHRCGYYSPGPGWRLVPVFLEASKRRLDPGNYDNIFSWR